jgi:hypothetical protein
MLYSYGECVILNFINKLFVKCENKLCHDVYCILLFIRLIISILNGYFFELSPPRIVNDARKTHAEVLLVTQAGFCFINIIYDCKRVDFVI